VVRAGQALQAALEDVLGNVACVVQRLWTSDQHYCGEGVPPVHRRGFCFLLNAALRDDDHALLAAAMPLLRAINSLSVVRGARPDAHLRFPPAGCCFRGGGLPDEHLGFFVPQVPLARLPRHLLRPRGNTSPHSPAPSRQCQVKDARRVGRSGQDYGRI
jgi:hypothetical protein